MSANLTMTCAQPQTASAPPTQAFTYEEIEKMSTDELLLAYKRTGDQTLKWPLILRYEGMIKNVALQVRGVYSGFAQVEDIVSEGILALMSSIDKFDPDKGVKFETYVSKRIRGMVIDLARRQDWTPRSVRRRSREIDTAINALYTESGRFPTDAEVAAHLGVTEAKYQEDLANISLCNVMSLDTLFESQGQGGGSGGLPGADMSQQPEYILQEQEMHEILTAAIASLRESEQTVLSLYYQKNLNMKEIAYVMGVSQPRVSQIHTKAIQQLRIYMQQYLNNG